MLQSHVGYRPPIVAITWWVVLKSGEDVATIYETISGNVRSLTIIMMENKKFYDVYPLL
jgi:hypothetical protein